MVTVLMHSRSGGDQTSARRVVHEASISSLMTSATAPGRVAPPAYRVFSFNRRCDTKTTRRLRRHVAGRAVAALSLTRAPLCP